MTPASHDYLFASINSLSSRDLATALGPTYWHTVVIDECHRMAADRFDSLVTRLRPTELLGLTATPERTDGQSLAPYFDHRPDGSPAVELRLWDALDMQLLAPFEYYGCDDDTDFSNVPWDRPGEAEALSLLVTSNEVRARLVIDEWRRLAADPCRGKAIAFCVSVDHARFMTERFVAAGLPAACITGATPTIERVRAMHALADGRLCVLVTVDLFNEGVDLPTVDTLLLLRPTQSALLFQQQIGRGLRLAPGKDGCLILDFVGQHRAEFRFDRLLGALTGQTRTALVDAIEHGFTSLPPGCHVHLQQQTRTQVLRNLRTLTHNRWSRLSTELAGYAASVGVAEVSLGRFVHDQRIPLRDIYRSSSPSGWTSLRRAAHVLHDEGTEAERQLSSRLGALLHNDDKDYLGVIQEIATRLNDYEPSKAGDDIRAQMLAYQVDSSRRAMHYKEFIRLLASHPHCARELSELAELLSSRSPLRNEPIPGLEQTPLSLHGSYRLNEIRTAIGHLTGEKYPAFFEGVLRLQTRKLELLFVTLDKSEGFHDRVAYKDYAISPTRFHWQTQNSAGPDTAAGRRYLESRTNGWSFQLFTRATKDSPYRACGPVRLESPEDTSGERPMSITWTLGAPLTPAMFREFSVLRGS